MSSLKFLTPSGEPWAPKVAAPRKKSSDTLKRVEDPAKAKAHHGFEVVGIESAKLELARRADQQRREDRGLPEEPFDEEAWLNKQKPRRAIPRVFFVPAAAEQAAGMVLAGGGWLRVRVVEILKG